MSAGEDSDGMAVSPSNQGIDLKPGRLDLQVIVRGLGACDTLGGSPPPPAAPQMYLELYHSAFPSLFCTTRVTSILRFIATSGNRSNAVASVFGVRYTSHIVTKRNNSNVFVTFGRPSILSYRHHLL